MVTTRILRNQVETVGDKYMAVSGLPELCQDQARCIARLALDMMELAMDVLVDGVPVVIIHSFQSDLSLHKNRLPRHDNRLARP
jgi:guanylate cyclase soluble subunit beta